MDKFIRLFLIAFLVACLAASPLAGINQHARALSSNSAEQEAVGSAPERALSAIPILLSPNGYVINTRPVYSWNLTSGASHYLLVIYKQGVIYYSKVVDSITCYTETCSISLPFAQPEASYAWKVRSLTGGKWGGFSALKTFTIFDPTRGPYPIAPSGSTYNSKPALTWTSLIGASYYQVEVIGDNYNYSSMASMCGYLQCSNTGVDPMRPGIYKWRLRAMIGSTWGNYSAFQTFTVKEIPGFYSSFDKDAAGWTGSPAVWKVSPLLGRYISRGQPGYSSSSSHVNDYSTIRYRLDIRRTGCDYCSNAILFRGTPEPLTSGGGWNSGYRVAFTNSGYFHIGYYQNGIWNWIIPWTYTPALNRYPVKLEVTMEGSYAQIYINGSRVAYGHLDNFSTGRVGVMFYTDFGNADDVFQVDEVRLGTVVSVTSLSTGGINMDALELMNAAAGGDPNVSP